MSFIYTFLRAVSPSPSLRKKILIGLFVFSQLVLVVLAQRTARAAYRATKVSDFQVDFMCSQALSIPLMCWCYEEHMRTCPINVEAESASSSGADSP
jgi:hypothetical protein